MILISPLPALKHLGIFAARSTAAARAGNPALLTLVRFECGVIEFMSGRSMRRDKPHILPYGDKAPEKHRLYLLGESGERLSLDPFLIARREDVYILNEVEGSPEYLSHATRERYKPSSAGEKQRHRLSRIFGYGVDEIHVSRLGNDLAPTVELEKAPDSRRQSRNPLEKSP